jgi:tetratricopeptide (TPR) repeat protein
MRWMLAFLVVASLALPRRGQADNKPAADAAFADGQRLFDRGDYRAACRKFEKSLALKKQLGTLFNVARCHKMIGKLAAAYEEFRAAEPVARARGQKKRTQTAVVEAAELAGRLAWLTVAPPTGAATSALEVRLDGRLIGAEQLGRPRPVDPGPHVVEAAARGHASRVTVVVTSEAQHHAIELGHPTRLDGQSAAIGGRPWLSAAWPEAVAAQAFRDGARLLEQGRDAEACAKFRASLAHARQVRTRLHLAHCLERLGKLAEASAELRAAEVAAEESLDYERADFAAGRIARAQERMARLVVAPPAGTAPPGLAIRLDGHELAVPVETPLLLDPGPHVLAATAPRHAPFSARFHAREQSTHSIQVTLQPQAEPLAASEPTAAPPVDAPPPPEPMQTEPGRRRRTVAVVTGSAGAAALGVSLFFAVRARSRWNEAQDIGCRPNGVCENEESYQLLLDANADANRAAIAAGVGVLAVGTGVVLYLTSPRGRRERASQVMPLVGPSAVGIALGASF